MSGTKWFTEANGTTIVQVPKGAALFLLLEDGTVEEHIPDIEDIENDEDIPDHILLARTCSFFLSDEDLIESVIEQMLEAATDGDDDEFFDEEEEEEEDED